MWARGPLPSRDGALFDEAADAVSRNILVIFVRAAAEALAHVGQRVGALDRPMVALTAVQPVPSHAVGKRGRQMGIHCRDADTSMLRGTVVRGRHVAALWGIVKSRDAYKISLQ